MSTPSKSVCMRIVVQIGIVAQADTTGCLAGFDTIGKAKVSAIHVQWYFTEAAESY